MASFRKRGKTWQYRVVSETKREYSKGGFATKKEAQIAAANREKRVLNGYEQGELAFVVFAREWLEIYAKDKLRSNTYKTYKQALENHAIPHFGGSCVLQEKST